MGVPSVFSQIHSAKLGEHAWSEEDTTMRGVYFVEQGLLKVGMVYYSTVGIQQPLLCKEVLCLQVLQKPFSHKPF